GDADIGVVGVDATVTAPSTGSLGVAWLVPAGADFHCHDMAARSVGHCSRGGSGVRHSGDLAHALRFALAPPEEQFVLRQNERFPTKTDDFDATQQLEFARTLLSIY